MIGSNKSIGIRGVDEPGTTVLKTAVLRIYITNGYAVTSGSRSSTPSAFLVEGQLLVTR